MLFSLFSFGASFFAHRNVEALTDSNFDALVNHRPKGSIFVVMFHGEQCPACQSTYPSFISAATSLKGIARFGHVDCGRQKRLANNFRIWSIPQFRIFDDTGISSISTFFRSESNFVSSVIDRLPVGPIGIVNESWLGGAEIPNAAVLVTSRWRTPWQWKAIASNFSGTPVKIGIANNRKNRRLFGTGEEAVNFLKAGRTEKYNGPISFLSLRAAIWEKFRDVLEKREHQDL
jgi:thiol-disulfide isomerase/thioredoxin